MSDFNCQVCGEPFSVPDATLDKYPGWEPKYCRAHSPNKQKAQAKTSGKKKRSSSRPTAGSSREENLTRAEVLAMYTDGPDTGVFTDGSAHPNPGPGGWGFVWVQGGEIEQEGHGAEGDTTNNRMEFTALIQAYRALPEDAAVTVFSDSQLCVNTITQWAPLWEKKGWTRKGDPLKNLDLVKELLRLYRAHPKCPLQWTRAHDGSRWNEYADSLASAWRREEV
ncbi:MAG: ribonuclease H [Gemmatimonadota bacterium]